MTSRAACPRLGVGIDELARLDALRQGSRARRDRPRPLPRSTPGAGPSGSTVALSPGRGHGAVAGGRRAEIVEPDPEHAGQNAVTSAVPMTLSMRTHQHYAWKIALKPGFIIRDRRSTSQLVMRMQPWIRPGRWSAARRCHGCRNAPWSGRARRRRPGRWVPAEASRPCRLRDSRAGRAGNGTAAGRHRSSPSTCRSAADIA